MLTQNPGLFLQANGARAGQLVTAVIEILLAAGIEYAEAFADDCGGPFPGEEKTLAGWSYKRQREFVTARRCARDALGRLGYPAVLIPRGLHREPVWPSGVTGSITHCEGYRAAVVAPTALIAAVGIDAEPHAPLPSGISPYVMRSDEMRMLDSLTMAHPKNHWGRIIFSVKEAVYKASFTMSAKWLDFKDVRLEIDHDAGMFDAELLLSDNKLSHCQFHGGYLIERDLIVAVAVPSFTAARSRVGECKKG